MDLSLPPSLTSETFLQHPLDLTVYTPEFIISPALDLLEQAWVKAKKKCFFVLCHGVYE